MLSTSQPASVSVAINPPAVVPSVVVRDATPACAGGTPAKPPCSACAAAPLAPISAMPATLASAARAVTPAMRFQTSTCGSLRRACSSAVRGPRPGKRRLSSRRARTSDGLRSSRTRASIPTEPRTRTSAGGACRPGPSRAPASAAAATVTRRRSYRSCERRAPLPEACQGCALLDVCNGNFRSRAGATTAVRARRRSGLPRLSPRADLRPRPVIGCAIRLPDPAGAPRRSTG